MSAQYELFKKKTIEATDIIEKAYDMDLLDENFKLAFEKAMRLSREIFMRVEDELEKNTSKVWGE